MPLEVIDTADPLAQMIEFKTSSIYEMMLSLRILLEPTRTHRQWAMKTATKVSSDFMDELTAINKPFFMGQAFFEFAVDYENHDDVPGFIDYVLNMSPAQFMFYVIGRVVPLPMLEEINLTHANINSLLYDQNLSYAESCAKMPLEIILADIPAFQTRLTDMWRYYWETVFQDEIEDLQQYWEPAILDRERVLSREGGEGLMQSVTGRFKRLPPPLPADHPIQEVLIIPSYMLPTRAFLFYGYGNVTVLFDATLTEDRVQEIEQEKEKAVNVLRALGDATRLNILQVIAHSHGKVHGQLIAKKLDISPSVVSRHLSQLKESGVLAEVPQEDRKIYYRLVEDAILTLPEKILDYIYT